MKYRLVTPEKNHIDLQPGDFILTHGTGFFDKLIQAFTASRWNHTALIIDFQGTIIELVEQGIRKNVLSKYPRKDVLIVRIEMSDEDRRQVSDYANVMLKIHEKYGFLTIATIAFKIISNSRLVIKLDGTLICSEFVANALSHGGVIWDKDPSLITPADLYKKFVKTNLSHPK